MKIRYIDTDRIQIETARRMVWEQYGYPLPEETLRPMSHRLKELMDGGASAVEAIRQTVQELLPDRQKPGQDRKEAYTEALRTIVGLWHEFAEKYAVAQGWRPPARPIKSWRLPRTRPVPKMPMIERVPVQQQLL